jgi:hypothetical protein
MTRTLSRLAIAILRGGTLAGMVFVLFSPGFAQEVVTARATIPFKFWVQGQELQAGDYTFDNGFPGSATIRREGSNSSVAVTVVLYAVPVEREHPTAIFVLRDGKYFLVELWGVQGRRVLTSEFQHRGEVSEQHHHVSLTVVESHGQ